MTVPAQIDACTVAIQSRQETASGKTWVHLLPSGTFSGRDGRGPYRAANAASIMENSRRFAGRTQIPVDYNHAIDLAAPKGGPSPAAGWITGLQSRSDGIWGAVEWTAQAAEHLAKREYRYLSPVIAHTPDGAVTAILRASLVNFPNLEQLVALASAEISAMDGNQTSDLTDLRKALGLAGDADMGAILAAVRELATQRMAAGAPNPAEYVPIGDFLRVTQELRKVHQGVEAQTAKMAVEDQINAGRLMPFMKDWAINLCSVNKPAFDDFIQKTGGSFAHMFKPIVSMVPPGNLGSRGSDLSDTDAHVAAVLGHSSEDFSKAGQR